VVDDHLVEKHLAEEPLVVDDHLTHLHGEIVEELLLMDKLLVVDELVVVIGHLLNADSLRRMGLVGLVQPVIFCMKGRVGLGWVG
jgi:hypothetical protein